MKGGLSIWLNSLALVVCAVYSVSATALPDEFIFNTSTGAPYTTADRNGFQDRVVGEAFKRIGLKARVEVYEASARALINANQNVDQGVAMRIHGLNKKYPNLIRIEEPIIENDFVAYSIDADFPTTGWQSLEPYILAYIHGWLVFERNLVDGQQKHAVKKPEQMFSMLGKGRVDLVLYERWQGLEMARHSGISVKVLEPPLASVDMYMFIHKDYAELAPKLADALRSMKADGTYQLIFDQTLNSLLNKEAD
jgi:polar amino acid transport system substrate-binding protein